MKPSSFVLYGGDNDLSNGLSPEEVLFTFSKLVAKIQRHSPQAPVTVISIKPSPSREYIMDDIVKTNDLLKSFVDSHDNMFWIDTYSKMLTPDGKPRTDLYVEDMLHLNELGYKIWRREVVEQLSV